MTYFFIFSLIIVFIAMLYFLITSNFLKIKNTAYKKSFSKKPSQIGGKEVDKLFKTPKKEVNYNQHFFSHKKIVITGELRYFKNRNELAKLLWENDAIIETVFNSTIDVLIVGKSNIDAVKLKNAYFLNIKVITEEELFNYFPDFKPFNKTINTELQPNLNQV